MTEFLLIVIKQKKRNLFLLQIEGFFCFFFNSYIVFKILRTVFRKIYITFILLNLQNKYL